VSAPLLQVRRLAVRFSDGALFGRKKEVLHDVSLDVHAGEVVALVGESGSGKSTLARVLAGLIRPDAGQVTVAGRTPRGGGRAGGRGGPGRVQMVFQDPFASLNPVHTVEHHLTRPLVRRRIGSAAVIAARVGELLAAVGLDAELRHRHPHALSGGQRQRVAIARALAADPEIILADEPTSMLDVSTGRGVLTLLRRLVDERRLALVLITHDLSSAAAVADRVLTLYAGSVVESGPARTVLRAPAHPYTQLLLASVPRGTRLRGGTGTTLLPRAVETAVPSSGCPFAPRCPHALDVCHSTSPPRAAIAPGHEATCHLYEGAVEHAALS
jgi:oligopeptide/dipeptide ABC transporter ATP-binding protein